MQKILIKNATLVEETRCEQGDLLIEGERIARVGPKLSCGDCEQIDATGLYLLPGGVDAHVHLSLPMGETVSSDDPYTAGKAAAFGGTTTMIDFVAQGPGALEESVRMARERTDRLASIDYALHMNISRFDVKTLQQIPGLPALGIYSIKVFTAYNGRLRLGDGEIFQVMRVAGKHDLLTMVHAENGDVIEVLIDEARRAGRMQAIDHALTRPAWGEVEASLRVQALAAQADAPVYLVHMNTAGEVDQLRYGRAHGVRAMGETCPQYLFFTEDDLRGADGANFVCSPPLRQRADQQGLWRGLEDGGIQVLATDHCPFFADGRKAIDYEGQPVAIPGKELGREDFTRIPNGLPGIGDRLPVFWTEAVHSERISLQRFVALSSTNPARIFGLYPRKGSLQVGADADIVLWDPQLKVVRSQKNAWQRTDYNLYEGRQLIGMPVMTFLRGRLLVRGEEWCGHAGDGQYLHRHAGDLL